MKNAPAPVECHIHSLNRTQESYLDKSGFAPGLLTFAIPQFGVQFRCTAQGSPLDMEIAALVAALRFIRDSLSGQRITHLHVLSSNAEFVFGYSRLPSLSKVGKRWNSRLAKLQGELNITVSFIERDRNKALTSPADLPGVPVNQTPVLKPTAKAKGRIRFKPIEKGIRLS